MAGKKKKNSRNLKILVPWILVLSVFIGELLFYTWCRVQCVTTGYEITKETKKYQHFIALQNNLKIELARLKSPKRIAEIAKNRLGLIMPDAKQTIIIP